MHPLGAPGLALPQSRRKKWEGPAEVFEIGAKLYGTFSAELGQFAS